MIQAAFNWWDYHLHEFRVGGLRYGDLETDDGGYPDSPRLFDEREVRLLDFGRGSGTAFTYLYDFGDDWHHDVEIEEHLAPRPAAEGGDLHWRGPGQTARGRGRPTRLRALLGGDGGPERPGACRHKAMVRRALRPGLVRPGDDRQGRPRGAAAQRTTAHAPAQAETARVANVTAPASAPALAKLTSWRRFYPQPVAWPDLGAPVNFISLHPSSSSS